LVKKQKSSVSPEMQRDEEHTENQETTVIETPDVEVVDFAAEAAEGTDTSTVSNAAVVVALQNEVDALKNQLLRAHADFDNFRKRTRQEKEDLQRFAAKKVLSDLLPVVDNFERALTTFGDDANELKTGVEMVYRQLVTLLEGQGVAEIEALEKVFDPNIHQAVMQESVDGKDAGIVIEVLQKGYYLNDKVLRPAMVKVTG
jgi:molecular chaperone GrpE